MAVRDIKIEHVRQAFSEIDREGINNPHRGLIENGYELLENGKPYSPKYVISIAHKYVNGQELNPNTFNSTQANTQLKRLGFSITGGSTIPQNQPIFSKYTWVPFYQEMCPKLLQYSPAELLDIIKQVLEVQNLAGLKDRVSEGSSNDTELTDIDPYTFLSYLNKTGNTKRLAVLGILREVMNLTTPTPTDVNGLPTSQAQSVWMFGYAYIRKPDDINQLRTLYKQVDNNNVTAEQFEKVLTIYKVGKAKLTEALFCQKPTDYLPINAQTIPWLKKRNLPSSYTNFAEYAQILEAVRQVDTRPFYEISWEAYIENNPPTQTPTKYYCVGVTFGGQDDQLARFVQEGIWQNGYRDENEKYVELIKNIPIGTKLAAKSSFTQGTRGETDSILQIRAIGEVVANDGEGHSLDVAWDEDIEPFSLLGKGYYRKTIQQVTRDEDIQLIFFHQADNPMAAMPSPTSSYPKNIILYGPPGTGKTYETIDLAVDIIDGRRDVNHKVNKTRFDTLRKDGQINFVTFHQSYTYEDFVMGLKPDVESGTLKFEQREGIFYKMAKVARQNYQDSQVLGTSVGLRPFDDVFEEFMKPLIEADSVIEVPMTSGIIFQITRVSERSVLFEKSNGSTKHTLSIDTLKRIYEGTQAVQPNGLKPYYLPLSNELIKLGKRTHKRQLPKNYVLIIDEINRANMSRVFGELITLLEDDKRLGSDNELTVTLPSGESFTVPPNLYLIGTMNTADKSLALLDIALRRRFEFIGKYPNYDVLDGLAKMVLEKLNKAILAHNKPADFLIGHAYFMGKGPEQLPGVFNNRVIPLLMEYFNGRTDMVKTLLKAAGVESDRHPFTDQLTVSDVGQID